MNIELAKKNDLDKLQEIYKKAREFMKKSGNTTQWGEDLSLIHISEPTRRPG